MIEVEVQVLGDDGPCFTCEGEVFGFIFGGIPGSLTLNIPPESTSLQ